MTTATHLKTDQDPTLIHPPSCFYLNTKELNCHRYALIALGIIISMGSLITAGVVYAQVGYLSFMIGGSGLIVGSILIAVGLYCNSKTASQAEIPKTQSQKEKKANSEDQHSDNSTLLEPSTLSAPISSVDSGETHEKENVSDRSKKIVDFERQLHGSPHTILKRDYDLTATQIPTRASDIKLPETLPKDIPSYWDISGSKWLENNHLNRYITYLSLQFPSIVYRDERQMTYGMAEKHSIESLIQYIFEDLPAAEIDNYNNLNLPLYFSISGNHWGLVYIDRENRTVEYYDSKKNYGNHNEIVEKLTAVADRLSKQEPKKSPYQFICKINKKLQLDTYQCGTWVLFFLEHRLINPKFDFNQLDINEAPELIKKYRIKILLKIVEMDNASISIARTEQENYLQYYKEKSIAMEKLEQDEAKMSERDRWIQILKGQPLDPNSQVHKCTREFS